MPSTPSVLYDGTLTVTAGAPGPYSFVSGNTTLQTNGADCVPALLVDLSAIAADEEFEIGLFEKVLSTSAASKAIQTWTVGKQASGEPLLLTPSVPVLHGWDWRITRIAGSADRAFEYSIRVV